MQMLMRMPVEPLSDAEETLTAELLADSGSVSLPYARGVFTALSCEPSLEDPALWLPWVLGGEIVDQTALRRLFALLMRDRYAITECLELGKPYAPHPEAHHAVVQFCKGFIRASQASKPWQGDTQALEQTLPLAWLAGYLKLDSLEKLHGKQLDVSTWSKAARQDLPQHLLQLYAHFRALRAESKPEPIRSTKVGRNEPCPCGSGNKFKRCCG